MNRGEPSVGKESEGAGEVEHSVEQIQRQLTYLIGIFRANERTNQRE